MLISSVNNQLNTNYEKLSTMKRINRAADDAAGLSIAQGLQSQVSGYDVASKNAADTKSMLNVADGALSSITDSLQRIRELSIQASNATYSDDDKAAIQDEIDALKGNISDVAGNTEYNTKKLLDGSVTNVNTALAPDGSGMNIPLTQSTLDTLGITDYDVNGDFDISSIDKAIKLVSDARSSTGASTNALDHSIAGSDYTSQNLTSARSNIEDLDVTGYISELQKNQILNEYRMFVQSAKTEQATYGISILLGRSV